MKRTLAILLGMILCGHVVAKPLTVAWRNKPPYHYLENGKEQGFLLERSKQIFARASVEAEFVEMPTKRIWQNFSTGTRDFCSIGWYRLPEREALVSFSLPLHVDRPHTVVAAPGALAQVQAHGSLASLLQDKSLTIGVVDGVSYGKELDGKIAATLNKIERRTIEPAKMMRMAAADRISFVLLDQDDWEYMQAREEGLGGLRKIDFPDMPGGLTRFIVCSKDVPAELMDKLNKAIEALPVAGKNH